MNINISSFQEGPYSALKEDEFFDAIDQSLDRIDRETDDYQRSVSHHVFVCCTYTSYLNIDRQRLKIRTVCINM